MKFAPRDFWFVQIASVLFYIAGLIPALHNGRWLMAGIGLVGLPFYWMVLSQMRRAAVAAR